MNHDTRQLLKKFHSNKLWITMLFVIKTRSLSISSPSFDSKLDKLGVTVLQVLHPLHDNGRVARPITVGDFVVEETLAVLYNLKIESNTAVIT